MRISSALHSATVSLSLVNAFQHRPPVLSTEWRSRRRSLATKLQVVTQESSAQAFSGAGPVSVDMNKYNLASLEVMADEWTAAAVPATPLQEEGVYLQPRNKQEIMADTIKVTFPRVPNQGLGLQLLELAGGRDDGLGITIVEDVVEGGAAFDSGILPGDSLVKVEIQTTSKNEVGVLNEIESEEVFSIQTECLGYEKTVESILSLPPTKEGESFILTLKRLRRKPKIKLTLQYPPDMNEENVSLELFSGENLRRALLVRGVKLNDALAARFDSGGTGDCGAEGTCATCAVSVTKGLDLISPPQQQEAQIFKNKPRWRMSCKTIVGYGMTEGDLTVRVSPRQWDQ